MLTFFGRGSAFTKEHNSAYFTDGNDLILLDCPMSTFSKLRARGLSRYESIYVLITHTHGDHVGGVAMLIA
ncbi:MAG: MBL fold metallo-hydrolase, partial [Clostridiales bacterium]|nr:MBL fold metallo-hydrolase [Clostridiales bacterium]